MIHPEKILEKASLLLRDNCIITGGHFRLLFDGNALGLSLNKGTIKSFDYAVKLFVAAIKKNIRVDLGILINDMGSSCEEDGCFLKPPGFSRETYSLPQEYIDILRENGLSYHPIKIFWEKHIRNRSKKELLKILKRSNHIKIEAGGIFVSDTEGYGKIILTRTQGKDKYGTPACPLIMAGLNIEQSTKYLTAINFYYTGEDNILNVSNYFVIEKGKRVSELFGCKMIVENLYFDRF